MKISHLIITAVLATVIAGCATPNTSRQEAFLAASPRSILVVPVVNRSVEVTAADYMLSTVSIPLAERGYYVFPINMVKRVLEDDGLSDSSMVHSAPTSRLAKLFGADAVLYVTIDRWDAKYLVLNTTVTVGVTYEIRDGKTDVVLWQNHAKLVHKSDKGGGGGGLGGLIAKAITAAVTRGMPNYMPLARRANITALNKYPGAGIPFGPYASAEELAVQSNIEKQK